MNAWLKTLTAVLFAAAAGALVFQARQASGLRAESEVLRRRQSDLTAELRQLRQQRDEAAESLATVEQENARMKSGQLDAEVRQLRIEAARWREAARPLQTPWVRASASKVALLKERLAQTPDARIPEFRFLTPEDWLAAASTRLETDEDYRRALAALRTAGEQVFFGQLYQALNAYIQAHPGAFPADMSELKPYFTTPVDEALLERWKVAPKEELYGVGDYNSKSVLTQKAPVDEDYDACFVIGATGNAQSTFLYQKTIRTLIPVFEAVSNSGLSDKDFTSNGHPDFSALRPFAQTPEQKAALERFLQDYSPPQ
jgi:hypothetical protein